ncbi:hypothetical protein LLG96_00180 [bacterium]|nr:hypothetical protein [bacterium]
MRLNSILICTALVCTIMSSLSCDNSIFGSSTSDSGSSPGKAIHLVVGGPMVSGTLDAGKERWYYFDAIANQTYILYLDDAKSPSKNYNGYVQVAVFRPDYITRYSVSGGSHYITDPYTFTALATERIYLQITGWSTTSFGSFGLQIAVKL